VRVEFPKYTHRERTVIDQHAVKEEIA